MQEIFLLLLVAVTAKTVFGINCFQCESAYEVNCAESDFDIEDHFKVSCDGVVPPRFLENEMESLNSTGCMKKVFIENGERKTVRSCFFGDQNATTPTACTRDPALEPVEEILCDVCEDDDYCNGASQQKWWLTPLMQTTLTLIVVKKVFC